MKTIYKLYTPYGEDLASEINARREKSVLPLCEVRRRPSWELTRRVCAYLGVSACWALAGIGLGHLCIHTPAVVEPILLGAVIWFVWSMEVLTRR